MSGMSRRLERNAARSQHKKLKEAWKQARRIQKHKVETGFSSDEERERFMPNGQLLGKAPTFKQFLEMRTKELEAEIEKPIPSVDEEVDLSWEEEPT